MFGTDYRFVPEHLRDVLLAAHDRHCNAEKILQQTEEGVLEMYDQYRRDECWDWWQTRSGERRCLPLLLEARKRLMNRMFHQTEETFHRFTEINDSLLDLSQKTCKKNVALYEAWPQASFALPPRLCAWLPRPKEEEEEWRNDCQVCGRIFANGTSSPYTCPSCALPMVCHPKLYNAFA